MTAKDITDHFEAAHEQCFDLFETGVKQLLEARGCSGATSRPVTRIVVSGGTARHKMVQDRLKGICKKKGLRSPVFLENHESSTEYR
jgi:molecular chaperone DnaK (HSP70)